MRQRFLVIFSLFIFAFLGVWGKLFYWQVVKAEELASLGQEQYAHDLEIPPKRGEINASDGFPLVTNRITYLLYADPKAIDQKDQTAQALSQILQIGQATISAKLSMDKLWVPIAQTIDDDTKQAVEKLSLKGLGFQEKPTRFYPEASMAAQMLGFVAKDEDGNDKGYFGVEGYYDMQLKGHVGQVTVIRDAFGKPVLAKLTANSGQLDGRNLTLHVDRVIQYLLEEKLKKGIETYGAKSGMAAVMDPKTGAILAMASFPSFDPRSFWESDASDYKNPFITDTYEPGSTFKPLVMAAAIDRGLVSPETRCPNCAGPVKVGDYELHTWNDKYFPNTNMIDVMIHSDNTGMVYVAQKLGLERMLSALRNYGLGQTTGIDLQGEEALDLKPDKDWYPIDLATAGFGQGIAVTPIQLLDAFSSIANGGMRMEPHVVDTIETPEGKTISIAPKVLSQTMSSTTAKVMTEILVDTVNKGEANFARLKGYRIAGKTGTASIPVAGHYDPTKTIASFIGFAPADDPKFAMLVIMNQPTTSIYGAETAAPVFFDIARDILAHYDIPPTVDE